MFSPFLPPSPSSSPPPEARRGRTNNSAATLPILWKLRTGFDFCRIFVMGRVELVVGPSFRSSKRPFLNSGLCELACTHVTVEGYFSWNHSSWCEVEVRKLMVGGQGKYLRAGLWSTARSHPQPNPTHVTMQMFLKDNLELWSKCLK